MQIESTLDYATDSWFCNVFTGKCMEPTQNGEQLFLHWPIKKTLITFLVRSFAGALNHQTAHHLFPSVAQIYYPQITPIIVQACKEFGVKYKYKDTMLEALGAHVSHLKMLGQEKEKAAVTRPEVWKG